MAIRSMSMARRGIDWDFYDFGGDFYVQRCDEVETITDEQAVIAARKAGYNVDDDGRVLEGRCIGESFHLFSADMDIARSSVESCCDFDGDRTYFDLSMFIEQLADAIDCRRFETKKVGRFTVDATCIARYLWCCLALEGGDEPDGTVFRGMDILQ